MKLLAETTGAFGLIDLSTGQSLKSHRPSVVPLSGFLTARIALGQVAKVADVPDDATDEDFEAYWLDSDGDKDLAVASFLSKFDPDATSAPAPKTNRRNK